MTPSFKSISDNLSGKSKIEINSGLNKTLKWFALVNGAVIVSIVITTAGKGMGLIPLFLILGGTFPFLGLYLSKWLAKKSHKIHIIDPNTDNQDEKDLYLLVDSLRKRAGIEVMPELGIFHSAEMNAFATGRSKNNSLVAFSDSLLDQMDDDAVAAVAAHEIAHIANGDMITLSIVQAVTNAIVLFISIPLSIIKLGALINENTSWIEVAVIGFVKFVIVSIMLFLGNLVVKAFSRKREFEADKLAAELLDPESMIKALTTLKGDEGVHEVDKSLAAYSAMKISSPVSSLSDIFSTHPSIDRRIEALSKKAKTL